MTASVMDIRQRWRIGPEARALIVLNAGMLAVGLAVLYSASAIEAMRDGHGSMYYLIKQLGGILIGIVAFAFSAKVDAERWKGWAWPIMLATIVLLLFVVLPGTQHFAPRINGSRRWINIGTTLQPSEFAKLSVVIWCAMLLVRKGEAMRRLTKGLPPFLLIIGVLDLLVILEPDLSQAMMFTLMLGIILFAGGVRIGHFVVLGALSVPILWHEIEKVQYALLRMVSFFDPGGAPAEASYQLKQSLVAVGSGGWFGVGFGQGRQQTGFLPFPYSDFIGGNIGEEWGFVGLLVVVLGFALYGWLGFRIARQARSPFQQLVAVGITVTTVLTAYLHIGVVIGLLPTTGLTLPFFSFGRSNLVLSLLMTGMLVNIGSTRERVVGERATDPLALAPA
ncbi:MAG: putative lipid II flippase FtsW [Gemmatimonadota bacterium]|nr:putative lipid II flippase FtsW [Gemmatimonadota bacterium]